MLRKNKFFKTSNVFFFVIIIMLSLINYISLPWFDEVFFASIATSFQSDGNLELAITPYYKGEILTYGPVYFILTAFSFSLFEFGIFEFRIVSFLFGLLICFLLAKIIRLHHTIKSKFLSVLILIYLFDPITNFSFHSGRMELVALFFTISSIYFIVKPYAKQRLIETNIVTSSLLASMALLTTPRIAVLLLPVAFVLLLRVFKERTKYNIISLFLWPSVILIVYMVWVIYAFGNLSNMFEYYKSLAYLVGVDSFVNFPFRELPIVIIGLLSCGTLLVYNRCRVLKDELFIISVLSILFFHLLVNLGSQAYISLVVPYYIVIFSYVFSHTFNKNDALKKVFKASVIFLLFLTSLFFALKVVSVLSTLPERQESTINAFIRQHIPENAKVIGDYRFYYAIEENNSSFINYFYSSLISLDELKVYLKNSYDYEYLIVKNESFANEYVEKNYIEEDNLLKIATLDIPESKLALFLKSFVPYDFRNSYECTIYQRQ